MLLIISAILLSAPVENPLLYIRSTDLTTQKVAIHHSSKLEWHWSTKNSTLSPTLKIQRIGPFHDVPLQTNSGWLKEKHAGKTVYRVDWHIAILTKPKIKFWVGCVYDATTHQPLNRNPRSDREHLSFTFGKREIQLTCNPNYFPSSKDKTSSQK
ncbi:MAG: hypothetical protein CMH60_07865 [Myxococcales bacterium]|nr:hypothetical protein [Myxococcales bacterium]|tara:strand:- start:1710 stop:2174 length:465 start_codon:yes stop_codon:yes gene_type:complete